ncbi:MAG: PDZ domain-containing protein [Bacteroidaceae bacterium]
MHPIYRFIENVFEELDAPGEWFFDRSQQMLYYYPMLDEDMNKAKVEIVRLNCLVNFEGNEGKNISYTNFENLIFRHVARTFMDNKEPLLRSDWTIYRGGAMMFSGAVNCQVRNCEFDQVGGNTVFVNKFNRGLLFYGCYIHESGADGFAFVGDPLSVRSPLFSYEKQDYEHMDLTEGPPNDNYPADCRVDNCLITQTGRFEKQTAPVHDTKLKNIETLGEQSATGLKDQCGVMVVSVPDHTVLGKCGIKLNDVIMAIEGRKVCNVNDLLNLEKEMNLKGSFVMTIWRNQKEIMVKVHFS